MTEQNQNAAVYTRVSTTGQAEDGFSLDEQQRLTIERAAGDGLTVDPEHVFVDAGISGSRADRPRYQAMLAAAAAGEFSSLYVWKLDRLGRDAEELLRARRMLEAAGVEIVSLSEGRAESTLVYGVRALVAQEEREKIGERTRMGLAAVAASGRQPCGRAPLGYRAVGEKRERRWVIDEREAAVVQTIFSAYLAGHGVNAIAASLNADGVRTRDGRRFGNRVVGAVLANPTYTGSVRLKGVEYPGCHEAIVDVETFEAVRLLRDAKRNAMVKGRPSSGPHIFVGGLLRCGACGGGMVPRSYRNQADRYACGRRHTYGADACSVTTVLRAPVDESFLKFFEQIALDVEGSVRAVRAESERQACEARERADGAERDAARAEEALARIRTDYQRGALSAADWTDHRDDLSARREASLAEAEQHRSHAEQLMEEAEALDARSEVAERLAGLRAAVAGSIERAEDVKALRAALAATFESVTLWRSDALPGGFWLDPLLRPEALDTTRPDWRDSPTTPVRRIPLSIAIPKGCARAPSPPGTPDPPARRSRTQARPAGGALPPRRDAARGRRGRESARVRARSHATATMRTRLCRLRAGCRAMRLSSSSASAWASAWASPSASAWP